MTLSSDQIQKLLGLVASAQDDELDCDGCFSKVAEFAEAQLADQPLSSAMKAVERHLQSCPCCADEFAALLDGLRAMDQRQ